jgi:UDP-2-acetamido-2,6-beta-L-arabino-hexul-4-ose reductase
MSKLNIGITGQSGFMGTHLANSLKLKADSITLVPFEDKYFEDLNLLENFVVQCDVIIHLAAMNRHNDLQVIYDTNIGLVHKLLTALDATNTKPHIIFASSTQEDRDNLYGKSKRDGRKIFEAWTKKNNTRFTGLIIPNVFGPFGNPYYNSVIATFCHQLTHNETPEIHVDGEMKLIYINELVNVFHKAISSQLSANSQKLNADSQKLTADSRSPIAYLVPHTTEKKVSEILSQLQFYKSEYFENGIFPDLNDSFDLALFNTFRCYMPEDTFPFFYKKHSDERGMFVEIAKTNSGGQFSFSTTKPGITRGNHFHTRKAERFAVIRGKAQIQLRKTGTDKVITYHLDGDKPAFVDMPIWYTHNITNIGNEELITLFWINEPYNPDDPDTFFEKV